MSNIWLLRASPDVKWLDDRQRPLEKFIWAYYEYLELHKTNWGYKTGIIIRNMIEEHPLPDFWFILCSSAFLDWNAAWNQGKFPICFGCFSTFLSVVVVVLIGGSYSHNGMNGEVLLIFNDALLDYIITGNHSCRFSAPSVIQLEIQQTNRICCERLRSNNSIEIMVL